MMVRIKGPENAESMVQQHFGDSFQLIEKNKALLNKPALQAQLDLLGTSCIADRCARNLWPPGELDARFRTTLEQLRAPDNIPSVSTTISWEEFQQYWRKAKEATSSSISGLQCGHWKTAAKSEYLAKVLANDKLITWAGHTAHAPEHWLI